jgi:hypothetical protein
MSERRHLLSERPEIRNELIETFLIFYSIWANTPQTTKVYICCMQVDDALIDKLSRLAMLRFTET